MPEHPNESGQQTPGEKTSVTSEKKKKKKMQFFFLLEKKKAWTIFSFANISLNALEAIARKGQGRF